MDVPLRVTLARVVLEELGDDERLRVDPPAAPAAVVAGPGVAVILEEPIRAPALLICPVPLDLAARAGVALMTVRELQHNLKPRRRNPRTLAAVSEALGWPSDQLARILDGGAPEPVDGDDQVLAELDAVRADLTAIYERLDAIERRLGPEAGRC